jgi:DNA-binding YbaB/EbfC family protein
MAQPNLNQILKQAQQMQAEMMKAQEQLKDETVEASAGGGTVKVTMSGDMQLRQLSIAPEAIDPEDPELLQDMVTAAINEAIRAAQELAQSKMGGITGGMGGLPGLGGPGGPGPSPGGSGLSGLAGT